MPITVSCQWCGKEFNVSPHRLKSGRGKFCSRKCAGKNLSATKSGVNSPISKSVVAECPICGREFLRAPWHIKDGRKKYCSKKCFNQWQSENRSGENHPNWGGDDEERECVICGGRFAVRPFSEQRTCGSQECIDELRISKISGENHYAWAGGPDERSCEWCGESFYVDPGSPQRYCSQKCYGAWRSEYMSGRNSPSYNPNKEDREYPPEFNKRLKKKIRRRDGYKCAICRLYGHDVHHIDYDKFNCGKSNLITLCSSCHGTTNANRDYWQPALSRLLSCRLSVPI